MNSHVYVDMSKFSKAKKRNRTSGTHRVRAKWREMSFGLQLRLCIVNGGQSIWNRTQKRPLCLVQPVHMSTLALQNFQMQWSSESDHHNSKPTINCRSEQNKKKVLARSTKRPGERRGKCDIVSVTAWQQQKQCDMWSTLK